MTIQHTDALWTIEDVSRFLRVPVSTLYQWRSRGTGPRGHRAGRSVRYFPRGRPWLGPGASVSVNDRWHTAKPRHRADGEPASRCREHKQYPSADNGQGDRWQVRWRNLDGKQCKRNFPKAGVDPDTCAEAFDAKIRNEISRDEYIDPNAGKITLRAFAE